MRFRSLPRKFLTTTVIGVSAALVLSSCSGNGETDSDNGDADDHRIPQEDIDRLNSSLAEANELADQLDIAGSRITRQCMEDQGFTVHPSAPSTESDRMMQALPGTEVPNQDRIPETDVAATKGFGLHEEWEYTMSDEYENTEIATDPEWLGLGRDHHDEYFEALHDRELVDTSEFTEEELQEHFDDDNPPDIGGCQGATIVQIYGSDAPDLADVDPDEVDVHYFPPMPADLNLDPWEIDFHTPELQEAKDDWSSCLEERGESSVSVVTAIGHYVRSFYEDHPDPEVVWQHSDGNEEGFIERPEEAPWEFEEAKEREIDFATEIAECADETGLRETRQDEWDQTLASMVIEHEEEMYTWEDQVRTALDEAQDLLAS